MRYDVQFKPKSVKELSKIPARSRNQIISKIELMSQDFQGDIKRLTDYSPEYRLRVGDYRILFEIEMNSIIIYRILHRREAYR